MPHFNFHLPWEHTPEEDAAKEVAQQRKRELADLVDYNYRQEQIRQANDLRELARGGIPIQAVERLKEINDSETGVFTSDFAPEEAALLRREGFRPLGIVTGSAMYHVGQAYASAYSSCEVTVLSDAYNTATQLAVSRMVRELNLIGGHGVVGVRLNLVRHEWADATVEVQVIGTAVEGPGAPPKEPWTSDLSGQEWYALRRAGYEPAGMVWGHCTYFVLTSPNDEYARQTWSNIPMTSWSEALGKARSIALNHVKHQAKTHGATGVAGVKIARRLDEVRLSGGDGGVYEYEHHNLVMSIIGTSIRGVPHAPKTMQQSSLVLSLLDGRIAPIGMGAFDAVVE